MKRGAYLATRIKKAARVYPVVLLITVGLLAIIGVVSYFTAVNSEGENSMQKVRLGLVGNTEGSYLGIGFEAVKSVDTIHYSIDLESMKKETADKLLLNGEIDGYLVIPEGFVTGIQNYKNVPLTFVVTSDSNTFAALLIREVADTIGTLVTESQSAMYSAEELADAHGLNVIGTKEDGSDDHLQLRFINFILKRETVYSVNKTERPNSLSTSGYYICAGIMLMLLMWGISCSSLLNRTDRSMERLLCSKGISTFSQVLAEYFCFFCVTFITFVFFAGVGGAVLTYSGAEIAELTGDALYEGVLFAFRCIPAMLVLTSIHFLVYEAFGSGVSVILVQFFITVTAGYVTGCFYPDYFFPETVRTVSSYLPWGIAFTNIRLSLLEKTDLSSSLILLVISSAVLYVSVLLRKREVNR